MQKTMLKERKAIGHVSVFGVFNFLLMLIIALCTFLPVLQVFCIAVSGIGPVTAGTVYFVPVQFQTGTLSYVLKDATFLSSFRTTVFSTVTGTAFAMLVSVLAAYPLSKPELVGRKFILYIFVIVMLFNAGMIPNYLTHRMLGLINNIWVLVLNGSFAVSNLFIIKNYMEGLPESVEEAARIDGAGSLTTLFRVVLPMSTPVLATIALFYAVGHWNDYMSGVLYITKSGLKPLQQYLYDLISQAQGTVDVTGNIDVNQAMNLSLETVQAATIVVSTVPIIIVYPFLQRFFVKGITIGSVKG